MGLRPQLQILPVLLTILCDICHGRAEESSETESAIPRILHQSWMSDDVRDWPEGWTASWRDLYPEWEYKLWTDDDNMELVEEKYPWFLPTYLAMNRIGRADACRVLYMHQYGGMYADLDFEALRNLEELLEGHTLVLAAMGSDLNLVESMPNAWMASVPNHQFWFFCLEQIITRVAEGTRVNVGPESMAGPYMLHFSVWRYMQSRKRIEDAGGPPSDLYILPPGTIYPIDWRHFHSGWTWFPEQEHGLPDACWPRKPAFDETACKKAFPEAYAITYWVRIWGKYTQ